MVDFKVASKRAYRGLYRGTCRSTSRSLKLSNGLWKYESVYSMVRGGRHQVGLQGEPQEVLTFQEFPKLTNVNFLFLANGVIQTEPCPGGACL